MQADMHGPETQRPSPEGGAETDMDLQRVVARLQTPTIAG